jgi:hypothetical protein
VVEKVSRLHLIKIPLIWVSNGSCFVVFLSLARQISYSMQDRMLSYPFCHVAQTLPCIWRYMGQIKRWESSVKQIERQASRRTSNELQYWRSCSRRSHPQAKFFPTGSWVVRICGGTRVPLIDDNTAARQVESRTGLLNLLCGAGIFGKIWSACGQYEIQYTMENE